MLRENSKFVSDKKCQLDDTGPQFFPKCPQFVCLFDLGFRIFDYLAHPYMEARAVITNALIALQAIEPEDTLKDGLSLVNLMPQGV